MFWIGKKEKEEKEEKRKHLMRHTAVHVILLIIFGNGAPLMDLAFFFHALIWMALHAESLSQLPHIEFLISLRAASLFPTGPGWKESLGKIKEMGWLEGLGRSDSLGGGMGVFNSFFLMALLDGIGKNFRQLAILCAQNYLSIISENVAPV